MDRLVTSRSAVGGAIAPSLTVVGATDPQIAVDDAGTSHVVWTRLDGTNGVVEHVSIAANGAMSEVSAISTLDTNATAARIGVSGPGIAHVVWQTVGDPQWLRGKVFHRVIAADGTKSPSVQVDPPAATGPPDPYAHKEQGPQVAVNDDGSAHVTYWWMGAFTVLRHVDVAATGAVGKPLLVSGAGVYGSQAAKMGIDDDGVVRVLWSQDEPDAGRYWSTLMFAKSAGSSAPAAAPVAAPAVAPQTSESQHIAVVPGAHAALGTQHILSLGTDCRKEGQIAPQDTWQSTAASHSC